MDDQTLSKIKKQDKKYLWKYVLLMVVCLVLGGIGGYLGARFLDGRVDDLYNLLGSFYLSIVPFVRYGMIVFSIILLIVQIFHYQKCKKELSHLCLDDEESVEKFDKLLSYGLYINNFGLLGIILLGGIAFYMIPKTFSSITLILSLILYFVVFISVIFFQNQLVNMMKVMSPEKTVSTFDLNFQQKLMSECDEAEKYLIYKAGFHSYQIMNSMIFPIMTYGLMIVGMLLEIGMLPFIVSATLWIASQITYMIQERRDSL